MASKRRKQTSLPRIESNCATKRSMLRRGERPPTARHFHRNRKRFRDMSRRWMLEPPTDRSSIRRRTSMVVEDDDDNDDTAMPTDTHIS